MQRWKRLDMGRAARDLRRAAAMAVLAGLVAGCLPNMALHFVGPADRGLPRLPDGCGMAQVAGVVGQPFVALARYRLPGTLRVLYLEQMVTAEVEPTRLNAAVDHETRITALFCG